MNRRQLVCWAALIVALATGWFADLESSTAEIRLGFAVIVCGLLFGALYNRNNIEKPHYRFSPRKGFVYFLLGLIIFPTMIIVRSVSVEEVPIDNAIIFTVVASTMLGVAGTFMRIRHI